MLPLIVSLLEEDFLPEGGLKTPFKLFFGGKYEEINKLKHLFSHKPTAFINI